MSFGTDSIPISALLEFLIAAITLISGYVVLRTNVTRLTSDFNKLQTYTEDGFDAIETKYNNLTEKFTSKSEMLDAKIGKDFKDVNKEFDVKLDRVIKSISEFDNKHSDTISKEIKIINNQLAVTEEKNSKIHTQLEGRIISVGTTLKQYEKDQYMLKEEIRIITSYEIAPLKKQLKKIHKVTRS